MTERLDAESFGVTPSERALSAAIYIAHSTFMLWKHLERADPSGNYTALSRATAYSEEITLQRKVLVDGRNAFYQFRFLKSPIGTYMSATCDSSAVIPCDRSSENFERHNDNLPVVGHGLMRVAATNRPRAFVSDVHSFNGSTEAPHVTLYEPEQNPQLVEKFVFHAVALRIGVVERLRDAKVMTDPVSDKED